MFNVSGGLLKPLLNLRIYENMNF